MSPNNEPLLIGDSLLLSLDEFELPNKEDLNLSIICKESEPDEDNLVIEEICYSRRKWLCACVPFVSGMYYEIILVTSKIGWQSEYLNMGKYINTSNLE